MFVVVAWGRSLGRYDDTRLEKLNTSLAQQITNFLIDQQNSGKATDTIRTRIQVLRQMARLINIDDPETVKAFIAQSKTWNNKTRTKAIDTVNAYYAFMRIQWKPPQYTPQNKLPYIPTEALIDTLINGTGKVTATVLQTIKDTGARIGEITLLQWKDLNEERKTLNITPEKGSNPRILPITDKLISMLKSLPKEHGNNIFQPRKNILRTYLDDQRKTLAERIGEPRLTQISFHTLRHWKGTMEYHKTKDIMHVKYVLGHKSITSTMIYINLENACFLQTDENFTCKIAHNEHEELELIEAGFEHVNNRDTLSFYRKRK